MSSYELQIKSDDVVLKYTKEADGSIVVEEEHLRRSILTGQSTITGAGRTLTFTTLKAAAKYPQAISIPIVNSSSFTITDEEGNFVKKEVPILTVSYDRIEAIIYAWSGLSDCKWGA